MARTPEGSENQVEYLQSIVGKYFPIYRTEIEFDIVNLYIRISPDSDIEEPFSELRKELIPQNYIPHIREDRGEYILSVKAQPEQKYRSVKTNVVMLIITICTTLFAGMWWWSSYDPQNGGFFTLYNLLNGGLYFTLPLMTILGVHEMGHYVLARHHGIKASLPFFIPFIPPLGTIGAFISIREPIPDKKSLIDLGVAGPIAGFIVAVPVSILGIYLGTTMGRPVPTDIEGTFMLINLPLIMRAIAYFIPFSTETLLHPTAFAGWIGFLVTGLNLLPAGQLDGGHVTRALFGENAKYASYAAAGFLVLVGIFWYPGWLMFALFIFFLVGLKHPPPLNDLSSLDLKRKGVGIIAILLLFTCFHPIPIDQVTYKHDFSLELVEGEPIMMLSINESAEYIIELKNIGEPADDEYNISYQYTNYTTWAVDIWIQNETGWSPVDSNHTVRELSPGENLTIKLEGRPEQYATPQTDIELRVVSENSEKEKTLEFVLGLIHSFEVDVRDHWVEPIVDGKAAFQVDIVNRGHADLFNITTEEVSMEGWRISYTFKNETFDGFMVNVSAGKSISFTVELYDSSETNISDFMPIYVLISIESQGTGKAEEMVLVGVIN
ncbi:MAG: site-2 protease family protein [Thermoplasmata archaeon]